MRRRTLFTAGAATLVAGTAAVGSLPAWAQYANDEAGANQTWTSGDQWGSWTSGDYTFYNNIWGSGAGSQTIWANEPGDWGVTADHPNTGGIKSYPNVSYNLGRNVSEMGQVTSTNAVTVPQGDGLAYNTAYDVWGNGNQHEIMIWTNWYGPVGPIGGQDRRDRDRRPDLGVPPGHQRRQRGLQLPGDLAGRQRLDRHHRTRAVAGRPRPHARGADRPDPVRLGDHLRRGRARFHGERLHAHRLTERRSGAAAHAAAPFFRGFPFARKAALLLRS